jgi:hypothetical protein
MASWCGGNDGGVGSAISSSIGAQQGEREGHCQECRVLALACCCLEFGDRGTIQSAGQQVFAEQAVQSGVVRFCR